jgi:hypothetical protein
MLFRTLRSESRRWLVSAAIALSLVVGLSLHAQAARRSCGNACAPTRCCERPDDEVWLVSCRGLPCFSKCSAPPAEIGSRLSYWRYDWESKKWQRSDEAAFFATEQLNLPTSIWAHGDRVETGEAFSRGWDVYQQLVCGADVGKMRFVIWSWPSAQLIQRRPVRDSRIKAFRAHSAGYYLGWVLTRLEPTTRCGLMGFSFGARVVTGALHVLAGGEILGQALPDAGNGPPRRHNVVLMAAALDSDWLIPGRRHGLAITQIERLLLLNNYCDWILKRYPKLCGRTALGYTGLNTRGALAPYAAKIQQVHAGRYIGKEHALQAYIYSSPLMALAREVALVDLFESSELTLQTATVSDCR